jgi:hypothetical protein
MEKGSILWGAPSIDITDQVIRAYNGMHVKPGTLGLAPGASAPEMATGGGDNDDEHAGASSPGDFGSSAAKHSSISK